MPVNHKNVLGNEILHLKAVINMQQGMMFDNIHHENRIHKPI